MSNIVLEAKTLADVKKIARKLGITDRKELGVGKKELIEKIRALTTEEAPKKARVVSRVNYRRMIEKSDPELYSAINPVLYLLPPLLETQEGEQNAAIKETAALREWNPWLQIYLELEGVRRQMSDPKSTSEPAVRILSSIQSEELSPEENITSADLEAFRVFYPVLTYVYALQYANFLFLLVYYDKQDIFRTSSLLDDRIKIAGRFFREDIDLGTPPKASAGMSDEEKELFFMHKTLISVKSLPVIKYLATGDVNKTPTVRFKWVKFYRTRNSIGINNEQDKFFIRYIEQGSPELIEYLIASMLGTLRLMGGKIMSFLGWERPDIADVVEVLVENNLLDRAEVLNTAIKNFYPSVIVWALEDTDWLSRELWLKSQATMELALVNENVQAVALLLEAGFGFAIPQEIKIAKHDTPKGARSYYLGGHPYGGGFYTYFTPLEWALWSSNILLADLLLENNVAFKILGNKGRGGSEPTNPLSLAVKLDDVFMLQKLSEQYRAAEARGDIDVSELRKARNAATSKGDARMIQILDSIEN